MAARDLELLETVELKFALADTDEQVARLVALFLVPVLGKLNDVGPVRDKAIAILSHINKRIKGSRTTHPLPVSALLDLYLGPTADPRRHAFTSNFALMYLQMGLARLNGPAQFASFHRLAAALPEKPIAQRQTLVTLLLSALAEVADVAELVAEKPVSPLPRAARELLCQVLYKVILLLVELGTPKPDGSAVVYPGLSTQDVDLVTNGRRAHWVGAPSSLQSIKINALRFLEHSPCLTSEEDAPDSDTLATERFIIYLAASCDPSLPPVASLGEDLMKRLKTPDWEDDQLVRKLLSVYLGSKAIPATAVDASGSSAFVPGASVALRLKVLNYLSRSVRAARSFPQTLQVITESLYGPASNPRLRQRGMAFMHWSLRMGDSEQLAAAAPEILAGIVKLTHLNMGGESADDDTVPETLRGMAYTAVGHLVRKVPVLLRSRLDLVAALLEALRTESAAVKISVQEGLLALAPALADFGAWATAEQAADMEQLIDEHAREPVSANRFCALRLALTVYARAEPFPRRVALGLVADVKPEVQEEARRCLNLGLTDKLAADDLPAFDRTVTYLTTHMLASDPTSLVANAMTALQSQAPTALYRPVTTLRSTAAFLRRLLLTRLALRQAPVVTNADDSPEGSDPMEGESVEALLEGLADDRPVDNPTLRTLLRRQLGTVWEAIGWPRGAESDPSTVTRDSLHLYLTLLFVLLRAVPLREESSGLSAGSPAAAVRPLLLRYLLELLVLLPASELAAVLAPELPYLRTFLTDPVAETRTIAAHLTTLVLLDTAVEPAELERLVNDSLAQLAVAGSTRPAAVEAAHGHAAFLGALVGRCTAAGQQDRPTLSRDLVVIVVTKLIDLIDATGNSPSWLYSTVFAALGDLARYQSLSRFFDTRTAVNSSGKQPAEAHCTSQAAVTLEDLFSRVLASTRERLCKATNPKVIEAGLGCLGAVALGFPGLQPEVITFFQETPQLFSKQPEVHFTLGEALVAMLIGWSSPLLDPYRDTVDLRALVPRDPAVVAATTHGALDAALSQLSDDMTPLRPPAVRKAAVLWALTLVRFGTVHPTLRAHLRSLHAAFARLFTDKDELVQEAAAKGVGLVFEAGDSATREELVYSLLAFFREGRPAAPLRVTGDSEVFGREQLGNAPDGSTVTTYQSILSLASDMNRPELVYQLMNLANHHAVWQSRCGAAFGFAAILARSRESLQPHMVTLIPSLFRSLYDPAPPVQTAMATIWRALVPDPPATLTAHFKAIMTDLLKNLGNRQWRIREASARAIADLIGTRDFISTPEAAARLDPYLEDLWRMAFRALDDIKESVREAALPLCRTLSALTLKLVEAKPGSASAVTTTTMALDSPAGPGRLESAASARAHTVLDVVLPFLLDRGLTADAEPVQQFSLRTLLQLSTKAGPYLTPYLPRLTTSLLEALTEFEPAALNYLSFHTEAYEVTPDQLDHARLSASRMSPVMEAVERGLDQIRDAATMDALVPALQQLIRKGTGLATRAGVARVVVVLCMRKSHLLRDTPHPAALVKALSGNLLEPSASLRKAWATAIGYLAPYVAKDITVVRLVQHLRKLYLTHPDSDLRTVAPVTLREIGRHAVTRLQATADAVLPLVYVGCRDRDDGTRAVWEEVWTECNAGNSQTVQLYQAEIIALGTELMTYDSWDLKKQAALAIEAAVATLGGKLDPAHAALLPRILEHLQGRTWAGKEAFLTCLATLVEALGATRTAETVNLDGLRDALLRECRRKDSGYRRVAIEALGRVVTSLQVDWFADAIPVLFPETTTATRDNDGEAPTVSPAAQLDDMDLDEPLNRPTLLMMASGRLKTLGALWTPAAAETQLRYADPVAALLVAGITDPVWKVQITALGVLGDYWQNARPVVRADPIVSTQVPRFRAALEKSVVSSRYTNVRVAGLQAVQQLATAIKTAPWWVSGAKDHIHSVLEAFAADEAPVVADTAKEAHQALM